MIRHASITFNWYGYSRWGLFNTTSKYQRRYGVNIGRLALRLNLGRP